MGNRKAASRKSQTASEEKQQEMNKSESEEWRLLSKIGRILLQEQGRRDYLRAVEEREPVLLPKRKCRMPF